MNNRFQINAAAQQISEQHMPKQKKNTQQIKLCVQFDDLERLNNFLTVIKLYSKEAEDLGVNIKTKPVLIDTALESFYKRRFAELPSEAKHFFNQL